MRPLFMKRCAAWLACALAFGLCPSVSTALTIENGIVIFNDADALAGGVTPGDAPGFPVTISVPGSYLLASNLSVPSATAGIDVTAAEVAIDLAGFRINGSGTASIGILGRQRALTVRNGTIRAFDLGIQMVGRSLLVENMRIADNRISGITHSANVGAEDARILNNTITRNSQGIVCGGICQIEGNLIARNTSIAVSMEAIGGGSVIGNTISFNSGGISGTQTGLGLNAIINNTNGAVSGSSVPIHPNACAPQAC